MVHVWSIIAPASAGTPSAFLKKKQNQKTKKKMSGSWSLEKAWLKPAKSIH